MSSLNGKFLLEVETKDDLYIVTVYNFEGDPLMVYEGEQFPDMLKHALDFADPLLANWVFGSEFLDWIEEHRLEEERD